MLVYRGKGARKGKVNMWTPENLILMREFEKDVRKNGNYKRTCLSGSDSSSKKIICGDSAFLSPLDLISDVSLLENMAQEDLDAILMGVMENR